jgi:hypothetical protein
MSALKPHTGGAVAAPLTRTYVEPMPGNASHTPVSHAPQYMPKH